EQHLSIRRACGLRITCLTTRGIALLPSTALTAQLLLFALLFAGALALLVSHHLRGSHLRLGLPAAFTILGAAGASAWFLTQRTETLPLGLSVIACALAVSSLRRFSAAGRLFLTAYIGMLVAFLAWGIAFLLAIPVSPITRALLLSGYPLLVITFP